MSNVQQTLSENERYSRRSILRSEKIYGKGFQSPGGVLTTEKFAASLDIAQKSGLKVLDLGSGLGGAALHIAEKYGAEVIGVDYSQNMVDICNERLVESGSKLKVSFKQGDASDTNMFAPNSFDLIWTRDTILYLEDKHKVWSNCALWLKQGGQLFVTDFGKKDGNVSDEFHEYYTTCHYYLQSLEEYKQSIEKCGFKVEKSEDISSSFNELNYKDLEVLKNQREEFLQEFTELELQHLEERWHKKISYTSSGNMKWLAFTARKL